MLLETEWYFWFVHSTFQTQVIVSHRKCLILRKSTLAQSYIIHGLE